jgi:hypothetical protein
LVAFHCSLGFSLGTFHCSLGFSLGTFHCRPGDFIGSFSLLPGIFIGYFSLLPGIVIGHFSLQARIFIGCCQGPSNGSSGGWSHDQLPKRVISSWGWSIFVPTKPENAKYLWNAGARTSRLHCPLQLHNNRFKQALDHMKW